MSLAFNGTKSAPEAHSVHDDRIQSNDQDAILRIREALESLSFGQVTISVMDGQVTQVERMQRTRLLRRRHN